MVSLILYWWKWIFDPKFRTLCIYKCQIFLLAEIVTNFQDNFNSDFAIDNTKCFLWTLPRIPFDKPYSTFFVSWWTESIEPNRSKERTLNGTTGNVLQTN